MSHARGTDCAGLFMPIIKTLMALNIWLGHLSIYVIECCVHVADNLRALHESTKFSQVWSCSFLESV